MGDDIPLLDEILALVPQNLREVPGSLLYSGRDAFTDSSALYLMGINPGGDPIDEPETVVAHARKVLRFRPANFSEYRGRILASSGRRHSSSSARYGAYAATRTASAQHTGA